MARWTFSDGSTSYVLAVNPSAGGSPSLKKRFHRATPCNPASADFVIRMEGRPEAPTGQFQGVIRSETQWTTLLSWWKTKPVITITDDLGRTFSVVPTGLQYTPATSYRTPWRTHYTFDYLMLSPAVI